MTRPLLTLFLTLLLSATTPVVVQAAPQKPTCYNYLLINARGTGELQSTSLGFRGMIRKILAALPGGGVHDTIYPAAPDVTQLTTLVGKYDIEQTIENGLKNCPAQKYALMGYSQGATVVNEVLEDFAPGSREGNAILGVVVIGNPYHEPNRQGNVDENGGTSTSGATGALEYFKINIPDAWYASGKVQDICFTNDQVCNGVSAANLFSPSHLYYPFSESVQTLGANFLIGKLRGS